MDTIHKKATRFAEANTYLLDNVYLNQLQKNEVELWFQLPWIASYTTFCACLIYHSFYSLPIKTIILLPLSIDILLGIVNWYSYFARLNKAFFLSIGHNFFQWIISLSTIGILIYNDLYSLAVIVFIGKLGLLALFSPSIILYTRFAKKYNMHPKYAFFKKYYDYIFPFEKLEAEPNEPEDDFAISNNQQVKLLSRSIFYKYTDSNRELSKVEKLKSILMERYPPNSEFHELAVSNRFFLTDLPSLLSTIINMEFPNGRETEGLALQCYQGLIELEKLGDNDSRSELIRLNKAIAKARENGLEGINGLFICFRTGLHKREDFDTLLDKMKW